MIKKLDIKMKIHKQTLSTKEITEKREAEINKMIVKALKERFELTIQTNDFDQFSKEITIKQNTVLNPNMEITTELTKIISSLKFSNGICEIITEEIETK